MDHAVNGMKCALCEHDMDRLYHSPGPNAITSLSQLVDGTTTVFQCSSCSHLQTSFHGNEEDYYDKNYNIFADVEEEDHIYAVIDDEKIFRTQHQARVTIEKLDLPKNARVLEYGSGKALSLRHLTEIRPGIVPFVFDVSKNYIAHWDKFIPKENQATYNLPESWLGQIVEPN